METSEALASDEPMSPPPSSEAPQTSTSTKIPPESSLPISSTPPATELAASPCPRAVAGEADASPAALLAASLVRARATYFERLSSTSRPSTSTSHMSTASSSLQGDGIMSASVPVCPPTPRHSMALRSQPLHPLAQHPLSAVPRAGACARVGTAGFSMRENGHHINPHLHQRQRHHRQARYQRLRRRQDSDYNFNDNFDDDEDDDDSVDTFFDKPSYTCYGAAVELSPASSYGSNKQDQQQQVMAVASRGSLSPQRLVAQPPGAQSGIEALTGSAGAAAATPCSAGYVRTLSARFARGVNGPSRVGTTAGLDGLFDDLVTHVGALLASHPDVETQMGMVQGLSDRLLQLHALCETLGRKEDEVEHLRGVLRELTTTRADAIRLKVQMAESLNGLQQEYYKVLRSAQLAQGTCKQHSARAAATRKQLVEVQSELLRYKRAVVTLRDRNRRLRSDNDEMAARLQALEQGRLGAEGHRSACYMALVQAQTPVLY